MKLEDKIAAIWEFSLYDHHEIEIVWSEAKTRVVVRVSRMYYYVPANFTHMKALSEIFGSDEINLNNWSSDGCRTCDYGSNYVQEFTIDNPTKELENV